MTDRDLFDSDDWVLWAAGVASTPSNWLASPVVFGDDDQLVVRHDGGLHVIDTAFVISRGKSADLPAVKTSAIVRHKDRENAVTTASKALDAARKSLWDALRDEIEKGLLATEARADG